MPRGTSEYPWLRLELLIRAIIRTRWWDAERWPVVKAELGRLLRLKRALGNSGMFN